MIWIQKLPSVFIYNNVFSFASYAIFIKKSTKYNNSHIWLNKWITYNLYEVLSVSSKF